MRAWGPAVQRVVLGTIFIAHGVPKLLPLGSSGGLTGTALAFEGLGLVPALPLAALASATEVLGGAALVVGWYARWAALALCGVMAVALWKVHWAYGFFLNWNLEPGVGHGMEYALALSAGLVSLMVTGPGAWSVDAWRERAEAEKAAGWARVRSGKV